MAGLGVEGVAIASIAKGPDRDAGRETFFVEGHEPFKLPPRDPALFFVQRLRDEAHRFAIGTHRARRKKEFAKSPLDEIAGVGPARKRALLHAFGTAKAVARAGLADLEKTPGLNAATARLVYDFLPRELRFSAVVRRCIWLAQTFSEGAKVSMRDGRTEFDDLARGREQWHRKLQNSARQYRN